VLKKIGKRAESFAEQKGDGQMRRNADPPCCRQAAPLRVVHTALVLR